MFDFAVEKSAGSLSPRVKWSHLQNYEFELPDLNKQRELAELLWAAEETKQTYKKLIDKSKGLIQAKFINIFKNTPKCKLCEITSIKMGQSPDSSTYNKDKKGLPFIKARLNLDINISKRQHCGVLLQQGLLKQTIYFYQLERLLGM